MCELCDESQYGYESCQDCGAMICYDDGTAYVTMSGDLFCNRCGRQYDEAEFEDGDDWDFYGADWYYPGSAVSEIEPEDTPREIYIGPGSENAADESEGE